MREQPQEKLVERTLMPKGQYAVAAPAAPRGGKGGKGVDFQERLAALLAMEDGARTLALKLYARFAGQPEALPSVLQLLQSRWGFPVRLLPLLWTQLRRAVFHRRGADAQLERFGAGFLAPAHVEQEEWVEAFARWLEALRTRSRQAKVSRRGLVRRHHNGDFASDDNHFLEGPKLGEGAYGEVYVMIHRGTGVQRAVKKIHKENLSIAADKAEDEVSVLKALDHPHIVRIYETYERQSTLHIVMDWAEGGTLASLLATENTLARTLAEAWVCTISQQMCAALEYMHYKGVIHCDLKPENAMLLRPADPGRGEAPHVLLVDFGISELVEGRSEVEPFKCRGTPLYLSPEGFEGHLTEKSDMWALGVMIYEMLRGRRPFQADNHVLLMCRVMQSEIALEGCSPLAQEVLQGLLMKDPIARLTAQECRCLGWFAPDNQLQPPARVLTPELRRATIESFGYSNHFHRVAMFAIATGLSMKEMEDVFLVFQSMDEGKSGYLTHKQFAAGLLQLGITEDPAKLVAILDMDQNGRISYTEFLAGVLGTRSDDLPLKVVREAFNLFDLDGDGSISLPELRLMLSGDGPLVEVLPCGQTVDEVMDEVGDGKGSISFEDFLDYLSSQQASFRSSRRDRRRYCNLSVTQQAEAMLHELDTADAASLPKEQVSENVNEQSSQQGAEEPKDDARIAADKQESPLEDQAWWDALAEKKLAIQEALADKDPELESAEPPLDLPQALPPLHQWLLETFAEPSAVDEQATALKHLLAFPELNVTKQTSDFILRQLSGLSRHFLAGLTLARLLAEGLNLQASKECLLGEGLALADLRAKLVEAVDQISQWKPRGVANRGSGMESPVAAAQDGQPDPSSAAPPAAAAPPPSRAPPIAAAPRLVSSASTPAVASPSKAAAPSIAAPRQDRQSSVLQKKSRRKAARQLPLPYQLDENDLFFAKLQPVPAATASRGGGGDRSEVIKSDLVSLPRLFPAAHRSTSSPAAYKPSRHKPSHARALPLPPLFA